MSVSSLGSGGRGREEEEKKEKKKEEEGKEKEKKRRRRRKDDDDVSFSLILSDQGPILIKLFNLNYFLEALSTNTITL